MSQSALQTLILSREAIVEPPFSSIEEWLGSATDDYYRVLAKTGNGAWHPERDAHLWVTFNIRAHFMQARTVKRWAEEAEVTWRMLDGLVAQHALPDRVTDLLYEAVLGYRLRRSTYVKRANLEVRTATRDLARLVEADLLEPRGETKGRHYVAAPRLQEIIRLVRAGRRPVDDPYPWMSAALRP